MSSVDSGDCSLRSFGVSHRRFCTFRASTSQARDSYDSNLLDSESLLFNSFLSCISFRTLGCLFSISDRKELSYLAKILVSGHSYRKSFASSHSSEFLILTFSFSVCISFLYDSNSFGLLFLISSIDFFIDDIFFTFRKVSNHPHQANNSSF